jgi:DinB superfamily
MNDITLQALEHFPEQLEAHYAAIPSDFQHWVPPSWDGIPSEQLTAHEQIWHVRDVEIQGYLVRLRRALSDVNPWLPSLDTDALAKGYKGLDAQTAFAEFRAARAETLQLVRGLSESQLKRIAEFEGYGSVTIRGLIHYLCSHDQQHLAGLQWLLGKIDAAQSAM